MLPSRLRQQTLQIRKIVIRFSYCTKSSLLPLPAEKKFCSEVDAIIALNLVLGRTSAELSTGRYKRVMPDENTLDKPPMEKTQPSASDKQPGLIGRFGSWFINLPAASQALVVIALIGLFGTFVTLTGTLGASFIEILPKLFPTATPTATFTPTPTPTSTSTFTPTPQPTTTPPSPIPATAYEPNNSPDEAKRLEFDTPCIAPADDQYDWYYFEIDQKSSVRVRVTHYNATGQLLVYEGDPSQNDYFQDGRGYSTMELPHEGVPHALENLSPGRYYVYIYTSGNGNVEQNYILTVAHR
jgi:hypothetical protein